MDQQGDPTGDSGLCVVITLLCISLCLRLNLAGSIPRVTRIIIRAPRLAISWLIQALTEYVRTFSTNTMRKIGKRRIAGPDGPHRYSYDDRSQLRYSLMLWYVRLVQNARKQSSLSNYALCQRLFINRDPTFQPPGQVNRCGFFYDRDRGTFCNRPAWSDRSLCKQHFQAETQRTGTSTTFTGALIVISDDDGDGSPDGSSPNGPKRAPGVPYYS